MVIAAGACAAVFAPLLAPHAPHEQFAGYPYAPPMQLHIVTAAGQIRRPFVYRLKLEDRLERRYSEDAAEMITITWWGCGRVICSPPEQPPLFLLGSDALGRDVWARLIYGGRLSLGIAAVATTGTLLIGVLVGTLSAMAGGRVDDLLMRAADLVLTLPLIYALLVLRGALPLVLEPWQVFLGLSGGLILVGWPQTARGVRTILRVEATQGYAEAALAAGASPLRVLRIHTLPAAWSYVGSQAALLVSASVLAEATLSYAGFGFLEPAASWGTMLHDTGSVYVLGEFPWLFAPAVAIASVSIAVRAIAEHTWARDRVWNVRAVTHKTALGKYLSLP